MSLLESARNEWDEGYRRLQGEAGDRQRHERLLAAVEAVTAELRRRVGQTFTLRELVAAYADAERWSRDAVVEVLDGPPPNVGLVEDAAFYLYARGATDYRP